MPWLVSVLRIKDDPLSNESVRTDVYVCEQPEPELLSYNTTRTAHHCTYTHRKLAGWAGDTT